MGFPFTSIISPCQGRGGSDAADMIRVALIVAEDIGAVEHDDPGGFSLLLKGRGRPIGEGIAEGDFFPNEGSSVRSTSGPVEKGFEFRQGRQTPIVFPGQRQRRRVLVSRVPAHPARRLALPFEAGLRVLPGRSFLRIG